jgi:hypothetical protein
MQNVCMQFPYHGSWRPDDVALASGQVQAIFPLCVCKGKLETSQTLKNVRTCCHDVQTDATFNCSKLLDTNERPDTWLGRVDRNMGSNFSKLEST